MTLRIFNRGAHPLLARLVSELDARGAPVMLDHLLVLDCLLRADYIDTPGAAKALQLTREDARQVLEAMASSQLQLLERRGHTNTATYHLAKEIGTLLKGKAGYTRARGLDPIRYAEMAREYLRDHGSISNAELRELLRLGESSSASVGAAKLLARWSGEGGFLVPQGSGRARRYRLRSDA